MVILDFNKTMIQGILTVIDASAGKGKAADFYVPFFKKHEDSTEFAYTEEEINSVFEYFSEQADNRYVKFYDDTPLVPDRLNVAGKQLLEDLRNGNTIEDYLFFPK